MAKKLSLSLDALKCCARALQGGALVAFPTETVYGLGAHALDEAACEKIFLAKGRPKSDPLIVHIYSVAQAEILTNMSSFQRQCFDILGSKFWPGPLTIIVKASHKVPKIVTAGGNSIALRMPSHSTALELLKMANIPIAAPSANKFGHISPTSAGHVMSDLSDVDDLIILDDGSNCEIGIESTVIKLDESDNYIKILRPGAINSLQIKNELLKHNIDINIIKIRREIKNSSEIISMDAPGQLLTHYAPRLDSFILDSTQTTLKSNASITQDKLKKSVLLDFNRTYESYKKNCLHYLDLSVQGSLQEASYNLFSFLRIAEEVEGAECILLPQFYNENNEQSMALFDRVYRSVSGKVAKLI